MASKSRGKNRGRGQGLQASQQRRPANTNRQVRAGTDGNHTIVEYIEGPLPSPDTLAKYEALSPGAADRIFAMAESQLQHRQKLESIALPATFAAQRTGQRNALIVTIVALLVSLGLGISGATAAAAVVGGTTVVALAGVFIAGRLGQERERATNR